MAHVQKGLSTAFLHAVGLLFSGDMPSGTAAKPRSAEEAFFLKFFGDPQPALVDIDRRLVEKGGLAAFTRLAWHTVEQDGTYKSNWHIDAICEHLEAVSLGDILRLLIMCPPRHMKPVEETQWVVTQRGRLHLRDVAVGDMILTHRGRFRRVTAIHENGVLPTVAVRTRAGRQARMAPDHPVLTTEGWKAAGLLTERDTVAAVTPQVDYGLSDISEDEAKLLGYFVGDGCTKFLTHTISSAEPAVTAEIVRIAAALGWAATVKVKKTPTSTITVKPATGGWCAGRKGPVREWLEKHGLFGEGSDGKRVPSAVLNGSAAVARAFLGAYWDCDGLFVHRGLRRNGDIREDVECSCTTISHRLAEDIQHLLTRLGIQSRLRHKARSIVRGGERTQYFYWMVVMNRRDDVAKFVANIPMVHPKKNVVRLVRDQFDTALIPDRVASVSGMPPARCLCLSVDEDHSFTANDIAVHNSLSVAVMWPAWDWIENPWRRFLFASYAHNLSIRDSVRCRAVLSSPWFKARWGDRFVLTGDQNTKIRFTNDKTGQRLSTSVGGQLTGEGGDIIGIDDSQNSLRADSESATEKIIKWWKEAMSTRLSNPQKGAYVLIQQRLKDTDLIGHVIRTHGLKHEGGEYYCLCLPARYEPDHPQRWFRDPRTELGQLLWPEHIDEDTMRSLELALGPYAASGQLQQRPTAREGGYFKRHWFKVVKTVAGDTEWVRGWDLAASELKLTKSDPDYTATVLIGFSPSRQRWIIAHAWRFREGPGEVRKRMLATAEADRTAHGYHRIAVPQDPGQAGKDQAQSFGVLLAKFSLECRPVTGKKVERATPIAGQAELGMVEILDSSGETGERDWNTAFLDELTSFPAGAHDDWVDALTIAFNAQSGGTTGLIDYYRRLIAEKKAKADAAAAGPQPAPYRVQTATTTNLAEATTTTAQRKP